MPEGNFLTTDAASRGGPCFRSWGLPLGDSFLVAHTDLRDRWAQCFGSLAGLRALRNDYDGEGSPAPPKATVDYAIAWLDGLRQAHPAAIPPHVAAGPDGEVTLVWTHGEDYLQVDVLSPTHFEWLLTNPRQPPQQWTNRGAVLVTAWQIKRLLGLPSC